MINNISDQLTGDHLAGSRIRRVAISIRVVVHHRAEYLEGRLPITTDRFRDLLHRGGVIGPRQLHSGPVVMRWRNGPLDAAHAINQLGKHVGVRSVRLCACKGVLACFKNCRLEPRPHRFENVFQPLCRHRLSVAALMSRTKRLTPSLSSRRP
jgi:hypothetical protein